MGDTVRGVGQNIRVNAQKLLKLPLTGMAKLFLASLPEETPNDRYHLDEFNIEFNIGIEAEAGTDVGAIAKVKPTGSFKCTYTWERKPEQTKAR